MASFRDRHTQPRESNAPRRKTPTRTESRNQHRRDQSFGSEAASRHELYVPTAYPLAEAVVGTVVAPLAEPSAPPHLDSESSFRTGAEDSVFDESAFNESSLGGQGTEYSLFSQGFSNLDSEGGGGAGDRVVGSREWSRHQVTSQRSPKVHVPSGEHPWAGAAGDEDAGDRSKAKAAQAEAARAQQQSYHHQDSEEWADDMVGAGEEGRGGHLHDMPPYPLTNEPSARSGLSHDLSGFSDFDAPARALSGGITDPHPAASDPHHLARIAGTGAAAAAAAEATNEAARRAKQEREAIYKPKPPGSHGSASVMDRGDTKEENLGGGDGSTSGMSEFRISTLEAASTHGDPYDERPVNENGTRGEYAVVRYHSVIFTPLMFLICGVLLFWEFHLNDWSAESLAENPSFGPSVETLIEAGAKRTDLIVDDGDWWRIISPMFLHAGVVHFLFNMMGFLQVGAMVEKVFGWWKVAAIYLVAGVFGTIVSAIFVPTQVMVGASGAIFGVFGALWADLWQNWSVYSDKCWALTVLGILTAVNVLLGLMPYLDNFAHCGGIIMGFFMGLGLLVQKREDDRGDRLGKKCYQRTLQLVSAIGVPTLMILGLSLLYGRSDPSEWCGWCEKISCVEFPPGDDPWWACDECSTVGFSAERFSNDTVAITCPDLVVRFTDDCLDTSDSGLTDCCIDLCL